MSPERRRRVDELFDRVADLPPPDQRRALEAECGEDRDLMVAVTELLQADAAGHPLFGRNIVSLADELLTDPRKEVLVPGEVGRYLIRERLGQGGMGTVYLAERKGLGDRVAIKFLRHSWSSPSERRRFSSEQRTLASLNHRYIARLYDAGVFEDTPWFVMEWVQGAPLTKYCQEHRCALRERLLLFRAACEAVSYAHRMLTIHRDLKPSNILVNTDGEVKLVDFGVAKQLDCISPGAGQTTTSLCPFSLNYAAPEQVRGEAVSVLADVYALGIILYELLTGSLPADLTNASALELSRWLEEDVQPPSMAARRRQPGDSPSSPALATPSQWRDLDLLCLTACRKSKDRRYRSVDDLIRDLDHFLKNEPLEAHPESLQYKLVKFCSRNRRTVFAAALVLTTIVAMSFFFTWRLLAARDRALASQARTERIHRLMLNLFEGDDESAGPAGNLRVVTLLDRGALSIASLSAEPAVQADLQATLGDLYYKLGHPDRAEPLLRAAFARRVALLGAAHPDSIRSQINLALFLLDRGRSDEANRLAQDALTKVRQHHPRDNSLLSAALLGVGKIASRQGAYDRAEPLLDQVVKLYSGGPPSTAFLEALTVLANTEYYLGRVDASESLNQRLLAMDRQLFGEAHPNVAVDLFNLGDIALDRGQYAKAEQLFRKSLQINSAWYSPRHPKAASDLVMIGQAVDYLGRTKEAKNLYAQALDIYTAVYGKEHIRVGQVINYQGALSLKLGKLDEAEKQFTRAAEIFKKTLGDQHEFYAHQLSNLGAVYVKKRQYLRAERLLQAALDRLVPALPSQRYTGIAHIRMANALIGQRRYRDAKPHALAGYRIFQSLGASSPAELQSARQTLAVIHKALRQPEKLQRAAGH